jgi:SAM-dependent methyltransferase
MPDLNEYSFFETPYSVASTLAKEITDHLPNRSSSFTVIDACAGSGRLSLQLVKHLPQYCIDVTLFDIQQDLLEVAKKQFTSEGFRVKTICIDLLRADVRHYCCHADIILCNPPFKGYRQCTLNERVLLRQFGLPPYNDIACAFVLRLLSYAPKNTILGILLRRDIWWSKGYETFRHLVDSYANVLATVDLGRALLSTPAIIPKDKKYLNLIIGCALTPAWRTAVRASIKSTNFTPSSVSRMLIPEYRTEVANSLEELGELAYKIVESYLFNKSIVPTSFEMEKFNLRLAAVNTELATLLGFDNQCASLYWGFSKPKSASSTDTLG